MPDLKHGQAVTIEWADSKSLLGWTYNSTKKRTPGYIRSLGYVVQLNDECLTISTTLDGRGASLDDFSVPLGCIRSLEVLPDDWAHGAPDREENRA